MEFDDAMIGALVEHEKFGRGIVLSHREPSFGLPASNERLNTVHIHCLLEWINHKNSTTCEICKSQYKINENVTSCN